MTFSRLKKLTSKNVSKISEAFTIVIILTLQMLGLKRSRNSPTNIIQKITVVVSDVIAIAIYFDKFIFDLNFQFSCLM